MNLYAFIFARGGSKGVPNKNIRKLGNKTLLEHSIHLAKSIKSIKKIFVSTDSLKIKNLALNTDINVINRPKNLASDTSPEWLSWQHAIDYLEKKNDKFDVFLSLPTTSPLRNKEDVEKCIDSLVDDTDIVITMTKSCRSPWFNMVKKLKNGNVNKIINDGKNYNRRQDVPEVFDMSTVAYVARTDYIKNSSNIFDGKVSGVEIPADRSIDIDTELDFEIADFLIKKRKQAC